MSAESKILDAAAGGIGRARHAMKNPVHVVCAANSRYMMPASVMLVSLVDHFDPERDLVIHIISNDATAQDKANVRDSIKMVRPTLKHIVIQWHSNDSPLVEKLPIHQGGHFTSDTYTRLFIPYILPEDCERAIYLDCDMVVLADVSVLYDFAAAHDGILHAAHDLGIPWVSSVSGVFDFVERGIPADAKNFCAAALVINLKRWRERDLTPKLIEYLMTYGEKVYQDQGALNAFLWQEWVPVDNRWNQGSDVLFEELWIGAGYTHAEWKRAKNNPFIIHYAGGAKPWKRGVPYPRFSHFHKYLAKTVYRDSTRLPFHPEVYLGFRIYYRLWQIALKLKGLARKLVPGLFAPAPLMSRHKQNLEAKNQRKSTTPS